MRTGGVYLIVHLRSGKVYVGQSTSFFLRWVKHKEELASSKHHNYRLQQLWSEDGPSAFEFRPLHFLPDGLSALERQRWLVRREEEVWEEYRKRDLALNIVRPEIVETPAALAEYKVERKAVTKAVTGEIRSLKPQLAAAKSTAFVKSRNADAARQERESAEALLKRNTGWRAFLLGRTSHLSVDNLKNELAEKQAKLASAEAESQRASDEAQAVEQRNKELYRSYPGNTDRQLRRISIFSGSRRKTNIR
jgi:GIY-YIG catalytic domain